MALDLGTISMAENAGLNDIALELETLEDSFEVAVARYDYPYRDGADLENMGQRVRTIRVRCFFWDDASQSTYDAHVDLVNLLLKRELLEFNHPKYGVIQGIVDQLHVRHDDRKRTAEVDFGFVEQMRGTLTAQAARDVVSSVEALFASAQEELVEDLEDDLVDQGIDPTAQLSAGAGVLAQIRGGVARARETAREIDSYLRGWDQTAAAIVQPTTSLMAVMTFPATVPGRIAATAARCAERVARLYDATGGLPARYISNLAGAFDRLIETTRTLSASHTPAGEAARALAVTAMTVACGTRLALEAAYCYAEDEQSRQVARQLERTPSFDSLGRRTNTTALPALLNSRELEESLASTRTLLQAGVDLSRGVGSLKSLGLELLTHVSTAKLEAERIITVEINGPLPVHLICLRYGLPYNYAERIRSINPTLVNPSFAGGAMQVYTLGGAA